VDSPAWSARLARGWYRRWFRGELEGLKQVAGGLGGVGGAVDLSQGAPCAGFQAGPASPGSRVVDVASSPRASVSLAAVSEALGCALAWRARSMPRER